VCYWVWLGFMLYSVVYLTNCVAPGVFAGFCSYIYCLLDGSCHSRLYIGSNKIEEENDLNPPTLPYFFKWYIRLPEKHHDYLCPHEDLSSVLVCFSLIQHWQPLFEKRRWIVFGCFPWSFHAHRRHACAIIQELLGCYDIIERFQLICDKYCQ